jgi:alpha-1,2-glucosyltransferase
MGFLSRRAPVAGALALIASLAWTWYSHVDNIVPKPYLDEYFHVPQAQKFCQGDWHSWDPKITTPPGLYLVAWAFSLITGSCSTSALRALNVGALCLIFFQVYDISRCINRRRVPRRNQGVTPSSRKSDRETSWANAHFALNVALFPPLFFFSGLFYTDVMSTLFVLLSYGAFLKRRAGELTALDAAKAVVTGVAALFFRQTNIFWVAVFPAGLAAVEALKLSHPGATSNVAGAANPAATLLASWNEGAVCDCSVADADLSDYVIFVASVVVAAFRKPFLVLKVSLPYIVLLSLFGAFVALNGGVVLGDKSNHVATLHLPQLLYIWPYICFFSFPLVLLPLVRQILNRLPESKLRSACIYRIPGPSTADFPSAISTAFFMIFGFAAVHLNTIVHPFTLADNRHYVFYVFRVLLRHPAIRYLAVPVYIVCGWLAIQTVGLQGQNQAKTDKGRQTHQPVKNDGQPLQISFVIVWMATTALSVVTAPLVEPRYYIVPWIIWRLHVPSSTAPWSTPSVSKSAYRISLSLETAWLIAINAAVGYNFLYRGFSWDSEPGNVQRFLW